MADKKTIVISDCHISDRAEYSWFVPPYPKLLCEMLDYIANKSEANELVLLGDIFDFWLYRIDGFPCKMDKILEKNMDVVAALQQCVKNIPVVYYIAGNHDMGIQQNDLQPLSSGGKNIVLITPESYNAKNNAIHLEHGHAVDMFNAEVPSAFIKDTIGGYPLGFFITRLIASAPAAKHNVVWDAFSQLVQSIFTITTLKASKSVGASSMDILMVKMIITLLEEYVDVEDGNLILYWDNGSKSQCAVGDLKHKYGSLIDTWTHKYTNPQELLGSMLACQLPNGLDWYAKKLFQHNPSLKVAVLGHTHYAKEENESTGTYKNAGCLCHTHKQTSPKYIQIVGETASLISWPPPGQ